MTELHSCAELGWNGWRPTHRSPLWPEMTVSKLCGVVSGTTFREYVEKMQRAGEWIDAACVHALGAAHGTNVVIFSQAWTWR